MSILRKVLVILAAVLLAAQAAWAGQFIRTTGEKVDREYIVVFKQSYSATLFADHLSLAHGGNVDRVWRHALNGALFANLSERQAQAMARSPMVAWVEENGVAEASATQTNPPWGLDRIDQRNLPLNAQYIYDYNGTNVHVYVLDSGIRSTHVEFGSRATKDFDSINDGQNGNDCNGHGTHVSGTIGGTTYGVAKNVRIHSIRVLNCSGTGSYAQIISGVDWVTANRIQPAVANMSLGGPGNTSLDTAVNNSVNAGVFYAVAAGNDNVDACTKSPARAAQAYTVGATDTNDARAQYTPPQASNWGTCLNIFGPGKGVLSASHLSNTGSTLKDGTSMASPHVAGVAALIRQQYPTWTVAQVKAEIDARATVGVVTNPGSGSPNRLLYSLTTAQTVPAAPSSLLVVNAKCYGENWLSWTAVTGATRYEVYGSYNSSYNPQFLEYSGTLTDRDVNVTQTTYYRVRACNSLGCSGYTNGNKAATYVNYCV